MRLDGFPMARGVKTGGRVPGSKNKRTAQLEAARLEASEKIADVLGARAFDGDAHALLMAVYKDGAYPIDVRLDAAKAAVRFEKPSFSSIELSGSLNINHEDALNELDGPGAADQAKAKG